jgi:hypothetical protein
MKNLFILLSLVLSLQHQSYAQEYSPGQSISVKHQEIRKGLFGESYLHNIPLPKGEWIVILTNEKLNDLGFKKVPMKEIILARVSPDNKLLSTIYLYFSNSFENINWLDEYCQDRKDNFLYINNFETVLFNQRCLSIEPANYLRGTGRRVNELKNFYNSKGIDYAQNIIKITHSIYNSNGKKLQLEHYIFPREYGFKFEENYNITANPWHKTNIDSNSEKQDFINHLSEWSIKYSDILFKSFTEPEGQTLTLENFNPNNKVK